MEKKLKLLFIWFIPLVSIAITASILYKNFSEGKFVIEVEFGDAGELVPGSTPVKYKNVEIGRVINIRLKPDLNAAVVQLEMDRNMEPYMTSKTDFWIHRANVSLRGISGLETILSGVHISLLPDENGESTTYFKGLTAPPVEKLYDPRGKRIQLMADDIGNINHGSGVYYKKINVGEVIDFKLLGLNKVTVNVFIKPEYNELITEQTQFWKSDALTLDWAGDKIKFKLNTLEASLFGGIELDNFSGLDTSSFRLGNLEAGSVQRLFESYNDLTNHVRQPGFYFATLFEKSVKGISRGSSVMHLGIKMGQVVDYTLFSLDPSDPKLYVLVLFSMNFSDLKGIVQTNSGNSVFDSEHPESTPENFHKFLSGNGIFVTLEPSNLISGAMFLNINFDPKFASNKIDRIKVGKESYASVPNSEEKSISSILDSLSTILHKVENLPINEIGGSVLKTLESAQESIEKINRIPTDEISTETRESIQKLTKTFGEIRQLIVDLKETNRQSNLPELVNVLKAKTKNFDSRKVSESYLKLSRKMQKLTESIQGTLENNLTKSEIKQYKYQSLDLINNINEMTLSIKELTNLLREKPEALIFGRGEQNHE